MLIFIFWKVYAFIFCKEAIHICMRERAIEGAGQAVSWDDVDRSEILDSLKYCKDESQREVLLARLNK